MKSNVCRVIFVNLHTLTKSCIHITQKMTKCQWPNFEIINRLNSKCSMIIRSSISLRFAACDQTNCSTTSDLDLRKLWGWVNDVLVSIPTNDCRVLLQTKMKCSYSYSSSVFYALEKSNRSLGTKNSLDFWALKSRHQKLESNNKPPAYSEIQ